MISLLQRPADEAVDLFFEHVAIQVLDHNVGWELNSVMRTPNRNIYKAMGSFLHDNDPPVAFPLMISDRE